MNKKIGIWLDSKNAIILSISANEEKIYKVNSNVESRVRYNGESKTYTRMGKNFILILKRTKKNESCIN